MKLPQGYNLVNINKVDDDDTGNEFESSMHKQKLKRQDSYLADVPKKNIDDQRICQAVLTKIKKTNPFKSLFSEENKQTYNKFFAKTFHKLESFYKNPRSDELLKSDCIVARFWKDFNDLIKLTQVLSKDPKVSQIAQEMESWFCATFVPHQHQCLEQTSNILMAKIEAQLNGKDIPYQGYNKIHHRHSLARARILKGRKEIEEMQLKMTKLPKYNQRIFYEVVGQQINSNDELDMNMIQDKEFNILQNYFKHKELKHKTVKAVKKARKATKQMEDVIEYNECSNMSFLSSSDEYYEIQ